MNKLQSVILGIANDITKLLVENDIPFFLDGGSALGAIRHKGFIPWDDDFDIIVLPEDFNKLVHICRSSINKDKYIFEEAFINRPQHISKIKLKGTRIEEIDAFQNEHPGIYIDIFSFDNASDYKLIRFKQYLFGRLLVAIMLFNKGYTPTSLKKKIALKIGKYLAYPPILNFIRSQTKTDKQTNYLSMVWARSRKKWTQYFCPRDLFISQRYVAFENQKFPVCNGIEKYLTICFGDYMQLPPPEKRKGLHVLSVDYGNL